MSIDDTIAAIATPLGEGGLGVIRLSGPDAVSAASTIFSSLVPLSQAASHTLHHGQIVDGENVVDDVVAGIFLAPHSYTGENVVEISCHGGTFMVNRVLRLCLHNGARLAEPGEFTRRAFVNGKMDLAQAEAVADLIAAHSETLRRLAMDQLQGRLSGYLSEIRQTLVDLLAQLEANLDFVEDEVPVLPRRQLQSSVAGLLARVNRVWETAPWGKLLREGLRAVIVGKPNVGKSSIFNALLRADRAIVTDVPGTTRDTLEERLLVKDIPVLLTDTAGLRPGAGPVETEGIARARRALDLAELVVFVTDASHPPDNEDREAAGFLKGKRVVLVLNKGDLAREDRSFQNEYLSLFDPRPSRPAVVRTSALRGEGLDELRDALVNPILDGKDKKEETVPVPTLISARHDNLMKETAAALQSAQTALSQETSEECVAVDLRRALGGLNQMTGEGVHDEILNAIFSRFCIGK